MTPEENALLARMDGYQILGKTCYYDRENNRYHHSDTINYDDERYLMPLAWKNGVDCDQELDGTWSAKAYLNKCKPYHGVLDVMDADPKKAIQKALIAIAREKYGE